MKKQFNSRLFAHLMLLIISFSAFSQEGNVFVKTAKDGSVLVKFIGKELIYHEGVNIYRSSDNGITWDKINEQPYTYQKAMDTLRSKSDSEYVNMYYFAQGIVGERKDTTGISLIIGALAGIENNAIAQMLGIAYQDKTAIKRKTYVYKVNYLIEGKENLMGISIPIKVGKPEPLLPPMEIQGYGLNEKSYIKWDLSDSMYYAYNLYKYNSKRNGKQTKLNQDPIIVNKNMDRKGNFSYPEYFFRDEKLINGTTYYYELTGIDAFGAESAPTKRIAITPVDKKAPPPPYFLKLANNKENVSLTWKSLAVKDLEGYNIYKSEADTLYKKINTKLLSTPQLQYVDIIQEIKSTTYYYKVSAIDKSGNESFSDYEITTMIDETPPAMPQNFKAVATDNFIALSWDKNTELDFMGYKVFKKSNKSDADYALITPNSIQENSFKDFLHKGSKDDFLYKICAIDSLYNSSFFTAPIKAKIIDKLPPSKPFLRVPLALPHGIELSWIENAEIDIMGYNIYKWLNNDWAKINAIPINDYEYMDTVDIGKKRISYAISAVDFDNNESVKSDSFSVKPITVYLQPPYPINLLTTIDKENASITLSWEIDGENEYAGFIIYRQSEFEEDFKQLTKLLKEKQYVDTSVENFTRYFYKVVSVSGEGLKLESDPLFVDPK